MYRIKWKIPILMIIGLLLLTLLYQIPTSDQTIDKSDDKLYLVATTTMLADLAKQIGGDRIAVQGLMGPGIDPHVFQASAGDVSKMQQADIILYHGLHLEGKMGDIFESLSGRNKTVICIGEGMDQKKLYSGEASGTIYDPHIWFSVELWKDAAVYLTNELIVVDEMNKDYYQSQLDQYLRELTEMEYYIKNRVDEINTQQRVLITAHDAFHYFGSSYGFTVMGLQGISTAAEAGTADMSYLAQFIAEHKIQAIFVESSVPPKTIKALQAAVHDRGFNVLIGGELYSDSLGDAASGNDNYLATMKANVDTIVEALTE